MATTIMASSTEPETEVEPEFPPHLITIDRYKRLVDSGAYGPDDSVFLWKGKLVETMTKGDPHAFSKSSIVAFMNRIVPDGWCVRPDQPIVLSDNSMPEPDVAIVRGSLRDYARRTPNAVDVALAVEMSGSSLPQDTVTKLRAYAADGIPVDWIVNLPKARLQFYAQPTRPDLRSTDQRYQEYGPDDEVPMILDGREVGRICVKEILP